jgi:hypothetical protein
MGGQDAVVLMQIGRSRVTKKAQKTKKASKRVKQKERVPVSTTPSGRNAPVSVAPRLVAALGALGAKENRWLSA